MVRVFFFLVGFGLTIIGCSYIIMYLNLMTLGYNFSDYVNFIISRYECYTFVVGIIMMILTLVIKGDEIR